MAALGHIEVDGDGVELRAALPQATKRGSVVIDAAGPLCVSKCQGCGAPIEGNRKRKKCDACKRLHNREYMRKQRALDPDRIRDRERLLAPTKRRWYEENREAVIAKQRDRSRQFGWDNAARDKRRAEISRAEGSHTREEFQRLCRELDDACVYCGATPSELTTDHVVPLSQGGTNFINNIVPACRSCNAAKGNRTPAEWFACCEPKEGG